MKKSHILLGALAQLLVPALLPAATLSEVPMQGGMAMPMVSYQVSDGRLHVMMPSDIPQLAPLLVSHPGDSFDPADPWFDALDPSRQGAAFSRRYGFVMDAMSDPLPPDTEMWIRKESGPLELRFYRYASSAPKAFSPIFGTAGTTNALRWNGMMFHPAVAAPPGTNRYTATFELFLVDSATGQEVPQSASELLTFTWSNTPDGRPVLSLEPRVVVAWPPGTASGWILESSSALDGTAWLVVTNTPINLDGLPCVILHSAAAHQYFRMRHQP